MFYFIISDIYTLFIKILTECLRDQICCRHIWRDKWGPPTELLPPSHIYGTLAEVLAIPVVNKEFNEFSNEDFWKLTKELQLLLWSNSSYNHNLSWFRNREFLSYLHLLGRNTHLVVVEDLVSIRIFPWDSVCP